MASEHGRQGLFEVGALPLELPCQLRNVPLIMLPPVCQERLDVDQILPGSCELALEGRSGLTAGGLKTRSGLAVLLP